MSKLINKRVRVGAVSTLVMTMAVFGFMTARPAFAGIGGSAVPDYTTPMIVGQTAVPVTLTITNAADGTNATESVSVTNITHTPSCGSSANNPCVGADIDLGVFTVHNGTGRAATACAGVAFTASAPDASGRITFTPGSAITLGPADGSGAPKQCIIDFTVDVLKVPTVDASVNGGIQTKQLGSAFFTGLTSNDDGSGTGSDTTTVDKATPNVTTAIHDAAHAVVTAVAVGSTVHDSAVVSGSGPTPIGDVTFNWFLNGTCSGSPAATSSAQALSGGTVDATGFAFTVNTAGSRAFQATYGGDANYVAGVIGACEPLSVVDANITIGADGTNPVNVNHTFTVTVMKNDGTGMVAAAGEHVDFSLINSGGATAVASTTLSTCDDAGANTNASGQCTIVFTSPTVGTTVGNASVTLSVLGISLTRDTDPATGSISAGPGGSGPATKTWTSFNAQMTTTIHNGTDHVTAVTSVPAGSTVHDSATVTGTNGGDPVPTGNVNFTFWSGASNCDSGQSVAAGTVALDGSGVAHPSDAQGPLSVGSYAFRAQYVGDANYPNGATSACEPLSVVDARITISQSGTNAVNGAHTFTVLVEKNDGTGWVPASGVTINSTETGVGSITGGTCGPSGSTDVNGQCTVTVNSASAGMSTVQASGVVSVGGINVNVATDGHGAHDISNQKTWVDANITIGPDGTNNVNVNHTFTVTVMKNAGAGMVAAAGEHVDFTLTDSGGAAAVVNAALSTCDDAGANTNASGQCTIVFTSATAGQTVGNATVTLSVGGVSLTRDTNPATASIPAGPGGSGPTTKTWVQPGGQYCSPGYWKQSQHFDSWVTYIPSQSFFSVFNRNITILWSASGKPAPLTNPSLLKSLEANGGGMSKLARVAVDALLNSTSMNSGFTSAQVISIVQQAIDTNDMSLLDQFTIPENCPLN